MTTVTLVSRRPIPVALTADTLKEPTSIGSLVTVIHKDMTMVGVIVSVNEFQSNTNAFCPMVITKKPFSRASDQPFDLWPIENLFYSSGKVTAYEGGINLK